MLERQIKLFLELHSSAQQQYERKNTKVLNSNISDHPFSHEYLNTFINDFLSFALPTWLERSPQHIIHFILDMCIMKGSNISRSSIIRVDRRNLDKFFSYLSMITRTKYYQSSLLCHAITQRQRLEHIKQENHFLQFTIQYWLVDRLIYKYN